MKKETTEYIAKSIASFLYMLIASWFFKMAWDCFAADIFGKVRDVPYGEILVAAMSLRYIRNIIFCKKLHR